MGTLASSLRRSGNERGAAAVEFAIVLPILLALLFGIIEWGIAFNQRLTVGNATQTAARVGTSIGNKPEADIAILEAIAQGVFQLPANGTEIIKRVQIYRADGFGEPISGDVNTYIYTLNGTATDGLCDWSPCPDPASFDTTGLPWDPEDRNVEVGNLDVMGVRIIFAHDWITGGGLLPLPDTACTNVPNNCWVDTAVMRLEPLQFGLGG